MVNLAAVPARFRNTLTCIVRGRIMESTEFPRFVTEIDRWIRIIGFWNLILLAFQLIGSLMN